MAKKDLRKTLDSLEKSQDMTARMEEKVQRLTELVERQKKIISEQTALLDEQKSKLGEIDDIPDDIIELKRIIGEQRAQLREKDLDLDHAKGSMVQAQKELELTIKRMNPTQIKIEAALETIGDLKAELAEKNTEVNAKNETLKTLSNRVKEAESEAEALKVQLEDFKGGISKTVVDDLKLKYSEERQKLKQEISNLETQLVEQKIKLVDDLKLKHSEEKQKLKQEISNLETQLVEQKIKLVEDLKLKHSEEKQKLKQEISNLETQLLEQNIDYKEKIAEAKDMAEKYNDMKSTLSELSDKNNEAKETIKNFEQSMVDLKKFKEENFSKIFFLDKLRPIMEEDPIYKSFFIIQDVGSISLEDLRGAVGTPIVTVKRDVEKLQKIGAVEMSADGKITAKKFE
ncbi:MAG: hypothetical protein ACFFDO_01570 [Candidatus Thorarchaeota archaeon]